jgi:hypothetical protein
MDLPIHLNPRKQGLYCIDNIVLQLHFQLLLSQKRIILSCFEYCNTMDRNIFHKMCICNGLICPHGNLWFLMQWILCLLIQMILLAKWSKSPFGTVPPLIYFLCTRIYIYIAWQPAIMTNVEIIIFIFILTAPVREHHMRNVARIP